VRLETTIVVTDSAVHVHWTASRALRDQNVLFWIGAAVILPLCVPAWHPALLILPIAVGIVVIPLAVRRYRLRPWLVLSRTESGPAAPGDARRLVAADLESVELSLDPNRVTDAAGRQGNRGIGTASISLRVRGERLPLRIFARPTSDRGDVETLARRIAATLGIPTS
jgi:hypothetical protein